MLGHIFTGHYSVKKIRHLFTDKRDIIHASTSLSHQLRLRSATDFAQHKFRDQGSVLLRY